ncbi:MAG: hypothetical protein IJ074_10400 [Clostridia bacterium]|nr:hypothetical protein [Clostridia bacterium]
MASQKSEISIPWPFAPTKVDLNQDTQLLKLIAMLTMFCDHAGKMLFPQYRIMRVIGRLAFPIYAYCIAVGCVYTRDILKYLRRIVLLALISQPIYAVALDHTVPAMFSISFAEHPLQAIIQFYLQSWRMPSILVSLSFGILIIWSIRNRQFVFTAALFLLCWKIEGAINYGMKGLILMTIFYLFCAMRWISLPLVASFMIWWGLQGSGYTLAGFGVEIRYGIQMYAILALPIIYIHTHSKLKLNKWLFYAFYPAHLLVIYLLDRFFL